METMPTLQEAFDALVAIPASIEVMYEDMDKVTTKHMSDLRTKGKTDAYWDDVKTVADKYGLNFTHPKFSGGLKPVETRPTVH